MNITDLSANDPRIEIAFEQFKSGVAIGYENVNFCLLNQYTLHVFSYSEFSNPEYINQNMALAGIERSKKVMDSLCDKYPMFKRAIENTDKEYYFCIESYKSGVSVAKEVSSVFQWSKSNGI